MRPHHLAALLTTACAFALAVSPKARAQRADAANVATAMEEQLAAQREEATLFLFVSAARAGDAPRMLELTSPITRRRHGDPALLRTFETSYIPMLTMNTLVLDECVREPINDPDGSRGGLFRCPVNIPDGRQWRARMMVLDEGKPYVSMVAFGEK